MIITLTARAVTRSLLMILVGLTALQIANLIAYFVVADPDRFDFVRLVDMDYEGNLPTLFNAVLFLIAGVLLLMHGYRAKRGNSPPRPGHWLFLALLFCFLGVDEGVKLHEYVGDFMERFVDARGFLYYPWVLPYLTVFAVLCLVYLPFYRRLPGSTRRYFFIAALLYICGAAGLDIVSAQEADQHGTETIVYSILYTVEEILEMLGLIVFIHALIALGEVE